MGTHFYAVCLHKTGIGVRSPIPSRNGKFYPYLLAKVVAISEITAHKI